MILTNTRRTGYLHPLYAKSLSQFGEPVSLPCCEGWVLKRQIPDSPDYDAMGCYPFFSCNNWSRLKEDLKGISSDLVSLSLVTDPFGDYSLKSLMECFPDVCYPFKEHFIIDLKQPGFSFISDNHKRNLRKVPREVVVERCDNPPALAGDWTNLYTGLITRHVIRGIRAFSSESFVKQLAAPGMVMFRALRQNTTIGALLWFVQGAIAYYHLGAYTDEGYGSSAGFALMWTAIEYFRELGLQWVCLGAGAGTSARDDGLTRYKRGWANGTRTVYFCGKIFDREAYQVIVKAKKLTSSSYFPLYRTGEFI